MATDCPKGARRDRRDEPGRRFRSGAGSVELAALLSALALDDSGLEGLLARRVERRWLARGVVSVRPVTAR